MQQAVIAHLPLTEPFGSAAERDVVAVLEEYLLDQIEKTQVGELDGEEIGGEKCVIYMYGPDADRLFEVVAPLLKECPLSEGGYIIKRYGQAEDASAIEVRTNL